MERLVDRYLRDVALAMMPLHPNQYAYQSGKSVETALHPLVVRVEKTLDQQETGLGIFYLCEPLLTPCAMLLSGIGLVTPRSGGSELPWRAGAILHDSFRKVAVSRGCPHGGVLSPFLWCLVVDDLMSWLKRGVYIIKMTFVFWQWRNS
jgi:hypothetical protein